MPEAPNPPLILLPGALGRFEGSDVAAERLGLRRTVIPVAYGETDSLQSLFHRIEALAIQAEAGPVDLLGQSYGGWIAQCFARYRPERVRRLVLSHSFGLSPRDAWRFRLSAGLFGYLPRPILQKLLLKRIGLALSPVAKFQPELHRRQMAALDGLVRTDTFIAALRTQQACMWQSLQPPISELPSVSAPVMIIESEDDPLVGKRARAALRARYPAASLLRFERTGHVSAIVAGDRYITGVEEFLDASSEACRTLSVAPAQQGER